MGSGQQLANSYGNLASSFEKAAENSGGGALTLAKARAEKALLRDSLKASLRAQNSDVTASAKAEAERSAYDALRKLEDDYVMSSADKIDGVRSKLMAYLADKNKPKLTSGRQNIGAPSDPSSLYPVKSPGSTMTRAASEGENAWRYGQRAKPEIGNQLADEIKFDQAASIVQKFPEGVSAAYQPLKRELKNLYSAEAMGTERMLRDYSNSPYGIGGVISGAEEATGGLVTGGLQNAFGGALRGKIGAGVSKFADEISAPQIALAANWMAKNANTKAGKAITSAIVNGGTNQAAVFSKILDAINKEDGGQ